MTRREEILRSEFRKSISIYDLENGGVAILCPGSVATKLYEKLMKAAISCSPPKRVVFLDGDDRMEHADFELIAQLEKKEAIQRIDAFVASLTIEAND